MSVEKNTRDIFDLIGPALSLIAILISWLAYIHSKSALRRSNYEPRKKIYHTVMDIINTFEEGNALGLISYAESIKAISVDKHLLPSWHLPCTRSFRDKVLGIQDKALLYIKYTTKLDSDYKTLEFLEPKHNSFMQSIERDGLSGNAIEAQAIAQKENIARVKQNIIKTQNEIDNIDKWFQNKVKKGYFEKKFNKMLDFGND